MTRHITKFSLVCFYFRLVLLSSATEKRLINRNKAVIVISSVKFAFVTSTELLEIIWRVFNFIK